MTNVAFRAAAGDDRRLVSDPRSAQHRVGVLWSWLPAFRAVAEVEHVQRAARALHVTASSLSRSIRLLEEGLGRKLFDRAGRNVKLNADGKILLAAVREGMRSIDDAVARVTGTTFSGDLTIVAEGDLALTIASRAATRYLHRFAGMTVSVQGARSVDDLVARLLRGEVDVALSSAPPEHALLVVDFVGEVTYGVYCGRGHPLSQSPSASLEAIGAHAFVAPALGAAGGTGDQWPRHRPRTVALRVGALQPAIDVCASGALLAVLPDMAVREAKETAWTRLSNGAVPACPLFVVRRKPASDQERASAFVEELRLEMEASLAAAPTARPARPRRSAAPKRGSRR